MDQGASLVYIKLVHSGNTSALHASGVLSSSSPLPLAKGHGGLVGLDNRRNTLLGCKRKQQPNTSCSRTREAVAAKVGALCGGIG